MPLAAFKNHQNARPTSVHYNNNKTITNRHQTIRKGNMAFVSTSIFACLDQQGTTGTPMTYCSACTRSYRPRRLKFLLRWPLIWWSSTRTFWSRSVQLRTTTATCLVIYSSPVQDSWQGKDECVSTRRCPLSRIKISTCSYCYTETPLSLNSRVPFSVNEVFIIIIVC